MEVLETNINACFEINPKLIYDRRGYFYESFNAARFQEKTGLNIQFVQDNQSFSERGVLRGLHLQKGIHAQAKLVSVLKKVLEIQLGSR